MDPALGPSGKKHYSESPCLWTVAAVPFLVAALLLSIAEQELCVSVLTAAMRAELTESFQYAQPASLPTRTLIFQASGPHTLKIPFPQPIPENSDLPTYNFPQLHSSINALNPIYRNRNRS